MAKGITGTGQGFDLPGRRLGGFSRQPPLPLLRQKALAAAENRSRLGEMLPSGPKRLGGDNSIKAALSPIQAAAMAAERRLLDDVWCGSKSPEGKVSSDSESSLGSGIQKDTVIQTSVHQETADAKPTWQCSACTLLNPVSPVGSIIYTFSSIPQHNHTSIMLM